MIIMIIRFITTLIMQVMISQRISRSLQTSPLIFNTSSYDLNIDQKEIETRTKNKIKAYDTVDKIQRGIFDQIN